MPKRIRINLNCVADRYASQDYERIIEFIDPVTKLGGLVSFFRHPDNTLTVQVYRADNGVVIAGPRAMLAPPKEVPKNPEHWRDWQYAADKCPGVIDAYHIDGGIGWKGGIKVMAQRVAEAKGWLDSFGWMLAKTSRSDDRTQYEIVIR